MPEETQIVVHTPELISPQGRFRLRMEQSRARMKEAVARVRERARELTPAARIQADPVAWILGAALVGFALGLLTGRRRRRR